MRPPTVVLVIVVVVLFAMAYACSSEGWQRVGASTYVEGTSGEIGGADSRDITTATVGFKPLAAMEPPTEVRWAEGHEPQPPPPPKKAWYEIEDVRLWITGIVTLILGALGFKKRRELNKWARGAFAKDGSRNPNQG